MKLRTVALSLIPGAAHIDLGRARRGLLYFFLFAFFLNGSLMASFLLAASGPRVACALAAAGIWILALYDAIRTAARDATGRPAAEPPERKETKPVA